MWSKTFLGFAKICLCFLKLQMSKKIVRKEFCPNPIELVAWIEPHHPYPKHILSSAVSVRTRLLDRDTPEGSESTASGGQSVHFHTELLKQFSTLASSTINFVFCCVCHCECKWHISLCKNSSVTQYIIILCKRHGFAILLFLLPHITHYKLLIGRRM